MNHNKDAALFFCGFLPTTVVMVLMWFILPGRLWAVALAGSIVTGIGALIIGWCCYGLFIDVGIAIYYIMIFVVGSLVPLGFFFLFVYPLPNREVSYPIESIKMPASGESKEAYEEVTIGNRDKGLFIRFEAKSLRPPCYLPVTITMYKHHKTRISSVKLNWHTDPPHSYTILDKGITANPFGTAETFRKIHGIIAIEPDSVETSLRLPIIRTSIDGSLTIYGWVAFADPMHSDMFCSPFEQNLNIRLLPLIGTNQPDRMAIASDGEHYILIESGQYFIVSPNRVFGPYQGAVVAVSGPKPLYVVREREGWYVIDDVGLHIGPYDGIGDSTVGRDEQGPPSFLAYEDGVWFPVFGGKRDVSSPRCTEVLYFDGTKRLYIGQIHDLQFVWYNGWMSNNYDRIITNTVGVTPQGTPFFAAAKLGSEVVVVGRSESQIFDFIESLEYEQEKNALAAFVRIGHTKFQATYDLGSYNWTCVPSR